MWPWCACVNCSSARVSAWRSLCGKGAAICGVHRGAGCSLYPAFFRSPQRATFQLALSLSQLPLSQNHAPVWLSLRQLVRIKTATSLETFKYTPLLSERSLVTDRSRRWAMRHRPKPPQLDSVRHAAATAEHCALFYIRARKSRRPISCYAGISQYAGSVGPAWRRPIKSKLPGDQPKQQRVVRLRVPLAVRLSHLHMLI